MRKRGDTALERSVVKQFATGVFKPDSRVHNPTPAPTGKVIFCVIFCIKIDTSHFNDVILRVSAIEVVLNLGSYQL